MDPNELQRGMAWFYKPDLGLGFAVSRDAYNGSNRGLIERVVRSDMMFMLLDNINRHPNHGDSEYADWAVTALDAAMWRDMGVVRNASPYERRDWMMTRQVAVPMHIANMFINRDPVAYEGSLSLMLNAQSELTTNLACSSYIATFIIMFMI